MPRKKATCTERAQKAKRESRTLDFKESFDPGAKAEWPELIKDLAAMANSGGGIIVFGVCNNGTASKGDIRPMLKFDPAKITDKVERYTGIQFADFQIHEAKRGRKKVAVLEIGPAIDAPMVFTRPGTYTPEGEKQQKRAFSKGTVYFRHGAKSEPATTADLRGFIERRVEHIRGQWLGNIQQVVEAPPDSQVGIIQTVAEDHEGQPTEVRLTNDPRAPVFGVLDPYETYPHRQKELVKEVCDALPRGAVFNSHDVLSIRRAHNITEETQPEFMHEPKWSGAAPQYSPTFVDWIVEQYRRDPDFFDKARKRYYELTHRTG